MMLSSYFLPIVKKFLAQLAAAGARVPREAASAGALPLRFRTNAAAQVKENPGHLEASGATSFLLLTGVVA